MPGKEDLILLRSDSLKYAELFKGFSVFLPELKDRLDFDRDVSRKRICADSASHTDSIIGTKKFRKEFTATVDYRRMVNKAGRTIN